ncbi:MAG: hypothetical protein HKL82_03295 [Acidimicrobiaceae bacterium]|nr:hypothetical protein [Acidimicrobiaceae bacterium]
MVRRVSRFVKAGVVLAAFTAPVLSASAASASTLSGTTNSRSNGIVVSAEFYSHTQGEIVSLGGYGYSMSDAPVKWAILNRTTNQYVKAGTLQWHLGFEIGSANGLAIGKYQLQYYHVDGSVGTEDFQVTDGGAGQ